MRFFLWKQEQNIFTVLYILLSPFTIGYTVGELLGEAMMERHKLKVMTVHKGNHIITFETFEQYQMFASYMVRRMLEKGEIAGEKIEMMELQDYDLWLLYIDELLDSNDIVLTDLGNCTVCRIVSDYEIEEGEEGESEKNESEKLDFALFLCYNIIRKW